MNLFGQGGGEKNSMETSLTNGLKLEYHHLIVMVVEKMMIVGLKSLVNSYQIMIFIWNLKINGLIEEI